MKSGAPAGSEASPLPVLEATELSIGYGLPVCPPLTVELCQGEVLAVVGANGAGKSTLLRTLVGQLEPLSGEIRLFGGEPDPRRRDVRAALALELGEDAFFPALTVREHLELVAFGHGQNAVIVDELLAEFGLAQRADASPRALSSGQRRRLLLAAAFARPRRLLVLDEPEQRLDTGLRAQLSARLAAEIGHGAVLMASHDPAVVAAAATRVLLIGEDEVVELDPDAGADAVERL
ncbi:ABC transporter ATP-binding protein [Bogoriella caseilytica]|uniref:ABC-type multidrug transport system ATPase subunit n=1 Tax=Bogoriella caseilytica TaxID=56055 RepID=A0A3N2B9I7_9MICO|nr:ABC transporter ATP-binding protein [Bogoriella caseilytica]ROR71920.1 ABC-type multidrug transport system ATPase subunit [Bogoriella caseilytica]